MGGDYPDWTRLFYLTGVAINIPINIVASEVTLPVSIASATVTIDVNLVASDVTMPVSIDAATVTLDVVLTAAEVTIDINFTDQSVAVFDAAKWFAHSATQWSVSGSSTIAAAAHYHTSRTAPAGKTAFVCGMTIGYFDVMDTANIAALVQINGVAVLYCSFVDGGAIILDVPFRATTGQVIDVALYNLTTGDKTPRVTFWGYDEAD
jgi:hypothetical protein